MTISAITRSQIPSTSVGVGMLMVSGTTSVADRGAGAIYTSQGATSGGPMAIQDASATWYNLVLSPHGSVNVCWFGATGDGSTDDTAAINLAISTMNTLGGGTIFFPNGTYMVNAIAHTINLNACGITLQNVNNITLDLAAGAVLQCNSASTNANNYAVILASYARDCRVLGGTIIGDRVTHAGSGPLGQICVGFDLESVYNFQIVATKISDMWSDGIILSDSNVPQNPCMNVFLDRVVSDNNRRQGMSIINAIGVTATGCVFSNTNGTAPANGIDMEPDNANQNIRNIVIKGCKFINNGGAGFGVSGISSGQVKATGNVFTGNTVQGFSPQLVAASASGSTITLTGPVPSWVKPPINGSVGMTILDVTTPGNIPASTTVASVSGNNIVCSASVSGVGTDTICFTWGADAGIVCSWLWNSSITDNVIDNTFQTGIKVINSKNNTFSGNKCNNVGGVGTQFGSFALLVQTSTNNTFHDTILRSDVGLLPFPTAYGTFLDTDAINNTFYDTQWQGTFSTNAYYNAGTGNVFQTTHVAGLVSSLLPAAYVGAGSRDFVTDATAVTFHSTVAGGGSNKVPVVSDGTNWLIG